MTLEKLGSGTNILIFSSQKETAGRNLRGMFWDTGYCSGAGTKNPHDYVGLTHNNLQIDNAGHRGSRGFSKPRPKLVQLPHLGGWSLLGESFSVCVGFKGKPFRNRSILGGPPVFDTPSTSQGKMVPSKKLRAARSVSTPWFW